MPFSEMMARHLKLELQTLIDQRRSGHDQERWYRSVRIGADDGVLYARVHVAAPDAAGDLVVRVFAWGLPYTFSDLPTDGVYSNTGPAQPWGYVGRDDNAFGERVGRVLREWFDGRELDPADYTPIPPADRSPDFRSRFSRLRARLSGSSPDASQAAPATGYPAFSVFAIPLDPSAP